MIYFSHEFFKKPSINLLLDQGNRYEAPHSDGIGSWWTFQVFNE